MASDYVNMLGYTAGIAMASTYSMKTMIPLRVAGIVSNALFIAYGYLAEAQAVLLMHLALLPLNSWRLHQMVDLVRRVAAAAGTDQSMAWLQSYMRRRQYQPGQVIFKAGDAAEGLYYTVSGSYRLPEIGLTIAPGTVIGELGLVSPGNRRTVSFTCEQAGELLYITYAEFRQLYFQNPQFGFAFLGIIAGRLFAEIDRLKQQGTNPPQVAGAGTQHVDGEPVRTAKP